MDEEVSASFIAANYAQTLPPQATVVPNKTTLLL